MIIDAQQQNLRDFQHWMEKAGVERLVIWALNFMAKHFWDVHYQ